MYKFAENDIALKSATWMRAHPERVSFNCLLRAVGLDPEEVKREAARQAAEAVAKIAPDSPFVWGMATSHVTRERVDAVYNTAYHKAIGLLAELAAAEECDRQIAFMHART